MSPGAVPVLLPVQLWGPRGDPVPVPAPSRAARASRGGHLTWDLVQELVGGAGQDPDPIQLWHQVGVLIQDESVLPAKGSREGSGAEPAQPSSVPPSPTPPAGPHEPPPFSRTWGGAGIVPPRQPSLTPGGSRGAVQGRAQHNGLQGLAQHQLCSELGGNWGAPRWDTRRRGAEEPSQRGGSHCTGLGWLGLGRDGLSLL